MKTQILLLLIALLSFSFTYAQESHEIIKLEMEPRSRTVVYSFIVNSIPDGSNIPLIGFVNLAHGSHKSAHIGFVNYVRENLTGTQISFINTMGGSLIGSQIGFINTAAKNVTGSQIGFVNTGLANYSGLQVGFINTSIKKSSNIQIGFVNTCADTLKGAQIGFINTSLKKTYAAQVGFVNTAKTLKGTQIGFINLVDSIESGFPLGFLSIVGKGGYHALELSVTEMFPLNLSYKIGVSGLYTSFNISYDPSNAQNIALGAGLGSLIPVGKKVIINPEFISQTLFLSNFQQMNSFAAMVGYKFNNHFTLMVGPSVVLQYGSHTKPLIEPFFSFSKTPVFSNGNLYTGARLALRYKF
jgi:hypothetical protein